MTERGYDVVVVGGGIVGSALAHELARRGTRTALIDRRDVGRASDAGAGILSPETTWRTEEIWCRFAAEAGIYYSELVAQLIDEGAPDPGYSRCGLYAISLTEGDEPWFENLAVHAIARGDGTLGEISAGEAKSRVPVLGDLRRVLNNPAAARIDGRIMTASLRHACTNLGVTLIDADIRSLETRGDRVIGVRTPEGIVFADSIVIAGGAWSSIFGEQLGCSLSVSPVKGQIMHLGVVDPDHEPATWPIVQPVLGHYLVPWPDRRVACGGTFEDRVGFDARPTAAGTEELLRECLKLAPGLASSTFLEVRVGFRPFSSDDSPVLGRLPGWENVHVDTGHGADGLLAGPYSGVLVAAGIRGEVDALTDAAREALRSFDPARFIV